MEADARREEATVGEAKCLVVPGRERLFGCLGLSVEESGEALPSTMTL